VRVDPEVVVAVADEGPVELREQRALAREPTEVLGCEVAAVETDLRSCRDERLDQPGTEALVRLGSSAVGAVTVTRHDEERRAGAVLALLLDDLRETPVRIAAAELVERDAREPMRLVERRPHAAGEHVTLEARCRAVHADPGPAPWHVDVVRERDGEPGTAIVRRSQP